MSSNILYYFALQLASLFALLYLLGDMARKRSRIRFGASQFCLDRLIVFQIKTRLRSTSWFFLHFFLVLFCFGFCPNPVLCAHDRAFVCPEFARLTSSAYNIAKLCIWHVSNWIVLNWLCLYTVRPVVYNWMFWHVSNGYNWIDCIQGGGFVSHWKIVENTAWQYSAMGVYWLQCNVCTLV